MKMLAAIVLIFALPAAAQQPKGGDINILRMGPGTTLLPVSEAEQVYQIVKGQWNFNSIHLNGIENQWAVQGLEKKGTSFLQLEGETKGPFSMSVQYAGSPNQSGYVWRGRITIEGYLERDASTTPPTFKVWFDSISTRLTPPQWTGRSSTSGGRMKD